jgi:hypothetical protein
VEIGNVQPVFSSAMGDGIIIEDCPYTASSQAQLAERDPASVICTVMDGPYHLSMVRTACLSRPYQLPW